MAVLNEGNYIADVVKHEYTAWPQFCRDSVTVITGQNLAVGTVVGIITASGKATILAPAAADGSQTAAGVIVEAVNATAADVPHYFLARGPAVLDTNKVVWPGGISAPQKATATAQLKALGIVLRAEV